MWAPRERAPDWLDFHAWATLMQRTVTPWDLKALRQIHDAHHRVMAAGH
jgi:hypothetical protein